jgi:hypothetical protein
MFAKLAQICARAEEPTFRRRWRQTAIVCHPVPTLILSAVPRSFAIGTERWGPARWNASGNRRPYPQRIGLNQGCPKRSDARSIFTRPPGRHTA